MKQQQRLIKELRKIAKERGLEFGLIREGGNHRVYAFGDERIPIPRHTEINDRLAQSIIREAQK